MQGEETIYINDLGFGQHCVIGGAGGHGRASEASGWKSDCGVLFIEKIPDPDPTDPEGMHFLAAFEGCGYCLLDYLRD